MTDRSDNLQRNVLPIPDRPMRARFVIVFVGILIIVWNVHAHGQSRTSFKYQFTPYFWLSGLDGTTGARGRTAEVDASFNDLLDHLDFAMMGTFEARFSRWRLLTDTLYIDVSGERGRPEAPFIDASVATRAFILDQEAGYPIFKKEGTDLNVTGGIRYWHLKNELQLSGARETVGAEHARGWVDPVVGLHFSTDLPKGLFVTAKADIGGFDAGARLDWQAYAGAGLKLSDHFVVTTGYRNLSVDYKKDGFAFDIGMKGVVLGLGVRF